MPLRGQVEGLRSLKDLKPAPRPLDLRGIISGEPRGLLLALATVFLHTEAFNLQERSLPSSRLPCATLVPKVNTDADLKSSWSNASLLTHGR